MCIPVSLQYVDQVIHCLCTNFHAIFLHNIIKIAALFSTTPFSKQEILIQASVDHSECTTQCLLNPSFMPDKLITQASHKAVSVSQYSIMHSIK